MNDIPRFNPDLEQTEWPWTNCDAGTMEHQQKYALLHKLNIPLGLSPCDVTCRSQILMQLMDFNEKVCRLETMQIVAHNGRPQSVMRVSALGKQKIRKGRQVDVFLKCLNEKSPTYAADVLLQHMAKEFNAEYVKNAIVAEEIYKKNHRQEQDFPTVPLNYDDTNPNDPANYNWNLRYGELLMYKKIHGDCLVPSRLPDDDRFRALGRWVSHIRTAYKNETLLPRRLELLNSVGFVWRAVTFTNVKDNPCLHKSIAAKLIFTNLTAREAMLLSGFPDEEASHDNRKKLVNHMVCNFDKRSFHCKDQVLKLLARLPADVLEIYEDSDIRNQLFDEGKITDGLPQEFATAGDNDGREPIPKRARQDDTDKEQGQRVIYDGSLGSYKPTLPFPASHDARWI